MDVIVFMSFIGDLEDLEVIKFRKCSLWSPRSVKRAKTKFPRFGAVVPKGSKDLEIQHFDVKLGKAPQIRNEVAQVLVVTGQQFQQLGIPLSTYCCFAIIIFVLSAEVIDAPTHQKKRKQECKSPVFKGRKVFKVGAAFAGASVARPKFHISQRKPCATQDVFQQRQDHLTHRQRGESMLDSE